MSGNGAIQIVMPEHPHADARGRVYEHVAVAEKAIGMVLPRGAVVHHIDDDRTHNGPDNLVVCEDQGYHLLIHRRRRAYRACGHASWFKCRYCKRWGPRETMYTKERRQLGPLSYHRACHAQAARGDSR